MRPAPRRVTREDVAARAGVSPTIVSYVVNANRYVDAEKKERVQRAIQELGYRPNTMARALKGKQSHHILFIADDLMGEHFGRILQEMDQKAYEEGYFISLCRDRNDEDFLRQVCNRYFDGVIVASSSFDPEHIQRLIDTGLPVVVLEIRHYDLTGRFGTINSGLYQGARDCVSLLLRRGRRRLLYVDSPSRDGQGVDPQDFRHQGFLDELAAQGFGAEAYKIIDACRSEEAVAGALTDLLAGGFVPDGIFGRTDAMAIVAMEGMKRAGYRVPEDCSVVGFNNSRIGLYTSPPLTSMEIRRDLIGLRAMEMLKGLIEGSSTELRVVLRTEPVIRQSL